AVKAAIAAKLEALSIFTRFAVGLSVAVLIIGAIIVGVSMMSSIHERIREIGILRAVGFRRAHLMRMFLIEILAVSLTSGCLGFIMGTAVAQFISSRIAASSSIAAWDPLLALVAIGLATVMGTVGGFYPAIRASQLDPVEALRAL
ncbi:MAG: FtsX-like permease family protein, partial [Chloroflexi bacterium]|nr:FtsX-like permease family protein [Chloroflexota bacterium]